MASKILIVAKREYIERVRSRWFIVITLAVPALMAVIGAIMVYIASRSAASSNVRHIRIFDATGAALGDRVAQNLMADSSSAADSVKPSVQRLAVGDTAQLRQLEDQATKEIAGKTSTQGYLVLTDSTLAGKSFRYAGRNASSVADIERLRTAVRQSVTVMRLQREGLSDSAVKAFNSMPLKMQTDRITDRGRGGSGTGGLVAGIVIAVLLFMSIIIHGQNVLRGVLEEKSSRVAEVVVSSVKPEVLLAGKVIGVGAVGLTQQAAWIGLGIYFSNFILPIVLKNVGPAATGGAAAGASPFAGITSGMTPGLIGVALAFFLVGFTFYASLYAAAGSMVNSEQEAQQAAMPVMLLLLSGYLMINPVMINPNSRLAVVMSWLPWSSPIIMPMRIGLTSVPPLEVAGSILVAMLACVGAVWLSARIYRVGMLMYGKKPELRRSGEVDSICVMNARTVDAPPEPTLGALLQSIAYQRVPAQFYQLLQLAVPFAFQCWAWGWKRTAGWLIVSSLFGIWALLEQRLDDDRGTPRSRLWFGLGRRVSGAAAGLLAGGLVFEGVLQLMRILFNCARCAG